MCANMLKFDLFRSFRFCLLAVGHFGILSCLLHVIGVQYWTSLSVAAKRLETGFACLAALLEAA